MLSETTARNDHLIRHGGIRYVSKTRHSKGPVSNLERKYLSRFLSNASGGNAETSSFGARGSKQLL